MPKQTIRRSPTLHERYSELLAHNPEDRDELQRFYYTAMDRVICGAMVLDFEIVDELNTLARRLAFNLGKEQGKFFRILKRLGFDI